jgi:hypothetical protein
MKIEYSLLSIDDVLVLENHDPPSKKFSVQGNNILNWLNFGTDVLVDPLDITESLLSNPLVLDTIEKATKQW